MLKTALAGQLVLQWRTPRKSENQTSLNQQASLGRLNTSFYIPAGRFEIIRNVQYLLLFALSSHKASHLLNVIGSTFCIARCSGLWDISLPLICCLALPFHFQTQYRYQDDDSPPPEHSFPRLTNEVRSPELVHVSEKNLSEIENVHGYVSHSHISPLKVSQPLPGLVPWQPSSLRCLFHFPSSVRLFVCLNASL